MKNIYPIMLLVMCLTISVQAADNTPQPISVANLPWINPPGISGVQLKWILGSEQHTGLYALRVKLEKGARIPPHTHPDERNSTVLSGTLYAGFGERFEESNMVAIHAGDVYVAPAGIPHYLYAKDGDVVYHEAGYGPTGSVVIVEE